MNIFKAYLEATMVSIGTDDTLTNPLPKYQEK